MSGSDGPPRAALIAALVLAVTTLGVVLAVAAAHRNAPHPVAIPADPPPHAQDPACLELLAALPQRLGDYQRVKAPQTPAGTAVWRAGDSPVVMQCGLDRPADFVVGAPIQVVDRVQWFEPGISQSNHQAQQSIWYTVDRPVYVALTLPPGSGPTPIQQLSEVIDQKIVAVPINPARPAS